MDMTGRGTQSVPDRVARKRQMTEINFGSLDGEEAVIGAGRVTNFKRKTVNWEVVKSSESS